MIKLNQIMAIDCPTQYKMHIAKYNGERNPLDDFIEGFDRWLGWNTWRSEKTNRFTRRYVISFIDFYPQKGSFLFGGIFEILNTYSDHYDIRLCEEYKDFIGRLKVKNINTPRGSAFFFENYFDSIEVVEIFDKSYSNHIFPGYEQIDFPFATIKAIITRNTQDWKSALESIKGVYMLSNTENGKRYIGSAYGDGGIWSRWSQYCADGHGGNKELRILVEQKGYDYIERNFKFTLLEIHPMFTSDEAIILRESYWKEVMMSRNPKFGYNSNEQKGTI